MSTNTCRMWVGAAVAIWDETMAEAQESTLAQMVLSFVMARSQLSRGPSL